MPAELVPSPQSIMAEYSAAVDAGSGSVNVATVPLKFCPSVALMFCPLALIGSSAGGGGWPPTPQVPAGMANAEARIGVYASFDHMTSTGANVLLSQLSPSSRKFGSPAIWVEKLNCSARVFLSTK